jgi:hypothetical protein
MRILLGTTPQQIKGARTRPLIQNLGPGNVYVDTDGDVDADSGFFIAPTAVYEFPASGGNSVGIWLVADADNTDVRIVGVG